jgi:AAA15 family ATPase/GTPase
MHLTKIGIENIRVFNKQQDINLAPITILTGPNNSGKSTFTKTLLLLKDTFLQYPTKNRFEMRSRTQELYYNYFQKHQFPLSLAFNGHSKHSLGRLTSIASKGSIQDQISIRLPFIIPEIKNNNAGTIELKYSEKSTENELDSIQIRLDEDLLYDSKFTYQEGKLTRQQTKINVSFFWEKYTSENFHLNKDNSPLEFEVSNMLEFSEYNGLAQDLGFNSCLQDFSKYYYPYLSENGDLSENYFELLPLPEKVLPLKLIKEFSKRVTEFIEEITDDDGFFQIDTLMDSFKHEGAESILSQFNTAFSNYLLKTYSKKRSLKYFFQGKYDETCGAYIEKFGEIDWFIFNPSFKTKLLLGILDRSISFNLTSYCEILGNCNLLSASEAGFDMLISSKDERLFNLLMHFDQIQRFDQQQKEVSKDYKVRAFITVSLEKLNLGKDFIVNNVQNYGYEILLDTGLGPIPLKDQGFGIRKLTSLILGISSHAYDNQFSMASHNQEKNKQIVFLPNMIILEEPEANLHPAFQSKLADILVLASKWFNMQFIVETHSEYLLRKLQYITASDDEIKTGDVIVYYFGEMAGKEATIMIEIEKDGSLTDDFGPGFYDEAIHTKFDLMRLKNAREN